MDNQEIERRIEVAKLAEKYCQSLLSENPIIVQYLGRDRWKDCEKPTFSMDFIWREKPKEPRVIYRWQARDSHIWYTDSATPAAIPSSARNIERYVQDVNWKAGE